MRTANTAIFIGVLIYGLSASRAPLHAQSSTSPIKIEGDDKPWNRGVPIASREAARDLFLEGNRLFNIPLYTRAAEKYIAAIDKWKHPAFYFNLALTQLNLGQQVEAHENLKQAIQHGDEPLGTLQFQEAQKQLQDLEGQLGRIHISCPTEGAEVTLDGTTIFTGPGSQEAWVKATTHEITAKKPTYAAAAKRVKISPGMIETLDLPLRKIFEERPWATWKPWVVVGTGVALVAIGGVFHTVSARKFSDYDNKFLALSCSNSVGCLESNIRPGLKAELNRARLEQQVAVGGYVAGGAVVVAGAVLLYLNRPHLVEQGPASSQTTSVYIAPTVSADMLGVLMTVSR